MKFEMQDGKGNQYFLTTEPDKSYERGAERYSKVQKRATFKSAKENDPKLSPRKRQSIRMNCRTYTFISGMRLEGSNQACEERHTVMGQNGPYKAIEIVMADGIKEYAPAA